MFRFEEFEIWKLAIDFADKVYSVAETFPKEVQFNLGSQLRASVLSISNNIAEGSGSNSTHEFRNFLNYSIRSNYETVSGLFLARKRDYIGEDIFQELYGDGEKLVKMIRSFRKSL